MSIHVNNNNINIYLTAQFLFSFVKNPTSNIFTQLDYNNYFVLKTILYVYLLYPLMFGICLYILLIYVHLLAVGINEIRYIDLQITHIEKVQRACYHNLDCKETL